MTVVQLTVAHPWFGDGAALFDEYRQHYGANPAPEAVESWMRDQILTDRMRLFAAVPDGRARGFCAVSVVPASLTLRTVWLVRDLYVDPGARRAGLARALLAHVGDAARAEGAHRLSLQTEPTNARALELYARSGFEPVTEVALLHRLL
jgi:GNAT superfamily N-acetyltransferase